MEGTDLYAVHMHLLKYYILYVTYAYVKVFEITWIHLHIYAMEFHSALVATRVASLEETCSLAALLPSKDSDSHQ